MQTTLKTEQLQRLKDIAENLHKAVFVWINPISDDIEAYIDIVDYKPPNPNINDFVDVSGKDITDYINGKWNSLNVDGKFDVFRTGQIFDEIKNTHLNFSSKYSKWVWLNKK